MTASPHVSLGSTSVERAGEIALRMLQGGASCVLDAWRIESRYDFVAHGRSRSGDLIVALRPHEDCPLTTMAPGLGVMVRVDLLRHSHDMRFSVVAASAHLVGELVLLTQDQTASALAEGELPERVADLAGVTGVRVGVVSTDRVLVHDHTGVTRVPGGMIRERPAPTVDDFAGFDAVTQLGMKRLRQVCRAVGCGDVVGQVTVRPTASGVCSHLHDAVICVDVTTFGVTLMHIQEAEIAVVSAPFETAAPTLSALCLELERLAMDSEPVRNQRI